MKAENIPRNLGMFVAGFVSNSCRKKSKFINRVCYRPSPIIIIFKHYVFLNAGSYCIQIAIYSCVSQLSITV